MDTERVFFTLYYMVYAKSVYPVDPADMITCGNTLTAVGTEPVPIEDYCKAIEKHGRYEDFQRCRIARVEHRKCDQGSEHEFILAHMEATGLPPRSRQVYDRWVSLERAPKHPEDISRMKNLSRRKLLKAGRKVPASDSIKFSTVKANECEGTVVLYSLDFTQSPSDRRPTIIDVAVLGAVISSTAEAYELYRFSCYWYARMLYEGLKIGNGSFAGGRESVGAARQKRGTWGGKAVVNDYGQLILESETQKFQSGSTLTPHADTEGYRAPEDPVLDSDRPFVVKNQAATPTTKTPIETIMGKFNCRVATVYHDLARDMREREAVKVSNRIASFP